MASVGVGSDEIDIKKAGTFPIVHGIRTLAIERGIVETPTARRIEALAAEGILGSETSRDLKGRALLFHGDPAALAAARDEDRPAREGGDRAPRRISTGDRDLLRDALRVVKRFRELIRNRYNLGLF